MEIEQTRWTKAEGFEPGLTEKVDTAAQLVLLFGSTSILREGETINDIRNAYPNAHYFGCSTAGEILGTRVFDDSLAITAIKFDHTELQGARIKLSDAGSSYTAGEHLAQALAKDGLAHVLVLSDGLHVNGSDLVKGLLKHLPKEVTVTGGLSGDGPHFKETLVMWDCEPQPETIAVLGLYGDRLKVGCGSLGGWDPFGPERLITRSQDNVLYELDGKSALELYKKYLGRHAEGLPAAGLLFPLSIRTNEGDRGLVRTILSVDEKEQSMIFAGDVPAGSYARLMKANLNRLVDGAAGAAETSRAGLGSLVPDLAILISCVGRKMVLKQRVEEEVEAVREVLGDGTALTGFYSYGEISPFTPQAQCELHNQTMTISVFSEQ